MKTIYLDNSATTALSPEVITKINETMACFGNPSSLHLLGVEAENIIREARTNMFAALGVHGAKAHNLVFTSCGSEANNMAMFGVAYSKPCYRGGRIITTASEHPSVLECVKRLERDGFDVVRLPAPGGVVDTDALRAALTKDTFLVSIMSVNNETGAVYDTAGLFQTVKRYNPAIVTHTDAVQGFCKIKLNPVRLHADLMTVSGHKIHAPKGTGALWINDETIKTKRIIPWLCGGGQENGYRSGTENTLGIAAMGEACKTAVDTERLAAVREKLIAALPDEVRINTPEGSFYPGILSVTLPDIKSETMLHFLSSRGIFVSSGSACSSNTGHGSYVLADFGLSAAEADCTLRLSFDHTLDDESVSVTGNAFSEGIATLVKIRR